MYFLSGLAIKEKHDRFTTEPFKHLYDLFCGRYDRTFLALYNSLILLIIFHQIASEAEMRKSLHRKPKI